MDMYHGYDMYWICIIGKSIPNQLYVFHYFDKQVELFMTMSFAAVSKHLFKILKCRIQLSYVCLYLQKINL